MNVLWQIGGRPLRGGPPVLAALSDNIGEQLEFKYRGFLPGRKCQFEPKAHSGQDGTLCIDLVSQRILAVPGATDRQQEHFALVRRFRLGLDDEHVGVPGLVAWRIHLLPRDFGSASGNGTDEDSSRVIGYRISVGPRALLPVAIGNHPGFLMETAAGPKYDARCYGHHLGLGWASFLRSLYHRTSAAALVRSSGRGRGYL